MGDAADLAALLRGAAEAVSETILANNGSFDPRPGSQAAREVEQQGPFVRRSKTPVMDAYSVALMRLQSALDHLTAIADLLDPARPYACASLARTTLENCARAWWALDPGLDVRGRIARGRADTLSNLDDALRYPIPGIVYQARPILEEVVADTEAIGLTILRDRRGEIRGVDEERLGATAVIREQLEEDGAIAYRDLSSVAHGGVSGMIGRMQAVDATSGSPGVSLMQPVEDVSIVVVPIAIAMLSFRRAMERRIVLYGWPLDHWVAWNQEAGRTILPLLRRKA